MEVSGLGASPGMQALRDRLFQRVDRNQDAGIDRAELEDVRKKLPAQAEFAGNIPSAEELLTQLDAGQDGRITRSELPQPSLMAGHSRLALQESAGGGMGAFEGNDRKEGFQEKVSQLYKQLDGMLMRQGERAGEEQASRLALSV